MLRTHHEIKKAFADRGLSLSGWAKEKGFNPVLVYQVLSGKRKTVRGESHRIAVELGLKEGCNEGYEELDQYLKGEEK